MLKWYKLWIATIVIILESEKTEWNLDMLMSKEVSLFSWALETQKGFWQNSFGRNKTTEKETKIWKLLCGFWDMYLWKWCGLTWSYYQLNGTSIQEWGEDLRTILELHRSRGNSFVKPLSPLIASTPSLWDYGDNQHVWSKY